VKINLELKYVSLTKVHFVGLYYVSSNYSYDSKGCGNVTHKSERV